MCFSIIIVNFNTRDLLKNCLNSIIKNFNKNDYEIIIVDNNSQDGSIEILKECFGNKIKLIANRQNVGFGAANNQGAKIAEGEYLFFLNSDTLVKENILVFLSDLLKSNKEIGVISPKLLLEDGSEQEYAFGKFPTLLSVIIEKFKKFKVKSDKPFEVDWVSGAALIIRKDIFNRINGFDEKFFMYFEDIDLCKRVKDLRYKVIVYPDVSINHLVAKSKCSYNKRKALYYKSQDYFYRKHFNVLIIFIIKLIRWPYKLLQLTKRRSRL